MPYSRTASASRADASNQSISQPLPVVPPDEAASTEVLITEQEVLFGTAPAVAARRSSISRRFAASIGRLFSASAHTSRPRPAYVPKRYEFLERSLMAREMDRL